MGLSFICFYLIDKYQLLEYNKQHKERYGDKNECYS